MAEAKPPSLLYAQAKWSEVAPQLESDPRFHHEALHVGDKQRMFRDHLQDLARKRLAALHALFAKHAPNLNTSFEEVYPEIANDFAVKRLKLTPEALQDKYDTWQRVRFQDSRRDFDTMLGESSFVEFWGRLRKKSLDQAAMAIKDEDEDEDEDIGAGGGGRASLADMAKHIDLAEMRAVLQVR
jgi:transcription elongation regulator 1